MHDRSERFLGVSAQLTGFGPVALRGTAMADEYLRTVDGALGADAVDALLAAAEAGGPEGLLADAGHAPVARNLIELWYCGSWEGRVVSTESYLAGLQWIVADAHPVGARPQGYGAWAVPPEAIGA